MILFLFNGNSTMQNGDHHGKEKKWGNFGWVFFNIFSKLNGAKLAIASDHQMLRVEPDWIRDVSSSPTPPDSPLYKSYSLLKLLRMEDEHEKKEKNLKPKKADKAIKMKSFSRLLIRKLFFRIKSNKTKNAENVGRISIGCSFSRIRTVSPKKRLKMAKSLTEMARGKKPMRGDECGEILMKFEKVKSERKFGGGEELCKKRILMGGKCKPLMGGMLQYDRDGVLKSDIRS